MNPQLSTTKQSQTHLSEEAIQDILIGMSTPDAEAHMTACEDCRSRVAAFRSDLDLFNQSSLAWAESKSESLSEASTAQIRSRHKSSPALSPLQRSSRLLTWKPLTAATAALLVAASALWNYQHASGTSTGTDTTQITDFIDTPDQIAEDNQLLNNVYNALDEEPQSPVNEFSVSGTDSSSRTSTKARTQ